MDQLYLIFKIETCPFLHKTKWKTRRKTRSRVSVIGSVSSTSWKMQLAVKPAIQRNHFIGAIASEVFKIRFNLTCRKFLVSLMLQLSKAQVCKSATPPWTLKLKVVRLYTEINEKLAVNFRCICRWRPLYQLYLIFWKKCLLFPGTHTIGSLRNCCTNETQSNKGDRPGYNIDFWIPLRVTVFNYKKKQFNIYVFLFSST